MENEDNNINNSQNHITVVPGDGKNLEISKVYTHLNVEEPNSNFPEKNHIIIPSEKK